MNKEFKNTLNVRRINEDTYQIEDDLMGSVNMYLLIGEEKALLIDSGYGDPALKELIASLTDKEVICVMSHGHVDHAMGAYLFEKSYLHSADEKVFTKYASSKALLECGLEGIGAKPRGKLRMNGYKQAIENVARKHRDLPAKIDDVKSFDLGKRKVYWVEVPGHTLGSIAFIDTKYHFAFDGDACGNGAWLFLEESSSLPDYLKSLDHYIAILRDEHICTRWTGHSKNSESLDPLMSLRDLVKDIIEKQAVGKKPGIPARFRIGKARMVIKGRIAIYVKP